MTQTDPLPARLRLVEAVSAAWIAQSVSVLAELGVADLLDEPRTAAELAETLRTDPDALERFLRAGCSADVLTEPEPGRFALTDVGALLRDDAPQGMRQMCRLTGRDEFALTWAHAAHTAVTGESAFADAHGQGLWSYTADPANEEFAQLFHRAMAESSAGAAVLDAHDFGEAEHVVDVGGGRGKMLAQILLAHPSLRGTVLDLPAAVQGAEKLLTDAGVAERADVVAGDVFTGVPSGADVYVLSRVIGNWDDDRALRILRSVRAAMAPTSRLLVVGAMPQPDDRTHYLRALDLYMFVMLQARLRTPEQYRELFAAAGLEQVGFTGHPDAVSMIEARPV